MIRPGAGEGRPRRGTGPPACPVPPGAAWIPAAALAVVLAWPGAARPRAAGDAPVVRRAGAPGVPAQQSGLRCQLCHAEPELLHQQAESPERAISLHVPTEAFVRSAHGEMACVECHRGFGSFPHEYDGVSTASCSSCHARADSAWRSGAHAAGGAGADGGSRPRSGVPSTAGCGDCHGVHDVVPAERLREDAGLRAMNGRCVGCHATAALPEGAPHADSVACHACHRPHAVRHVETPGAAVAAVRQAATCGACHDSVAALWAGDVHGSAVTGAESPGSVAAEGERPAPPACTDCHGQHGMRRFASGPVPGAEVSRCRDCHEDYADTFGDSYHGQAVSLGSPAAASCADCHTAHDIRPASDPRSSVAEANLVETCGACHPEANASFVEFQAHADPHDREKNPIVFWTYRFMTFLLVGVLGVFGLHTLLWLVRIGVARVRGEPVHRPDGGGREEGR